MPDDGPGLFTIGHSNQALDHFLSLLQRHGIEAVADVRTVPWSRYVPHFNAKTLGAALASQGIDYVPLGRELGGRPAGDEFYDEQGHVLYGRLAASPAFQDGLDQVLARGRTSSIALLCAEEDPARCHRHLVIGRVLRQRGVPVSHIRRDGAPRLKRAWPPATPHPPSSTAAQGTAARGTTVQRGHGDPRYPSHEESRRRTLPPAEERAAGRGLLTPTAHSHRESSGRSGGSTGSAGDSPVSCLAACPHVQHQPGSALLPNRDVNPVTLKHRPRV